MSATPNKGNKSTGSSAVVASGTASVIHQITMSIATAATAEAWGVMPHGSGVSISARQAPGPANNPTRCRRVALSGTAVCGAIFAFPVVTEAHAMKCRGHDKSHIVRHM
jgi:hypothetical protein